MIPFARPFALPAIRYSCMREGCVQRCWRSVSEVPEALRRATSFANCSEADVATTCWPGQGTRASSRPAGFCWRAESASVVHVQDERAKGGDG